MILFLFLSLTSWFYILYLIQDQPKQIKNIVLRLTFWSVNSISWCMNFEKCSIRQCVWVVRHIVRSTHLPSADSRSTDSPSVTLFSTKSGYTLYTGLDLSRERKDVKRSCWPPTSGTAPVTPLCLSPPPRALSSRRGSKRWPTSTWGG